MLASSIPVTIEAIPRVRSTYDGSTSWQGIAAGLGGRRQMPKRAARYTAVCWRREQRLRRGEWAGGGEGLASPHPPFIQPSSPICWIWLPTEVRSLLALRGGVGGYRIGIQVKRHFRRHGAFPPPANRSSAEDDPSRGAITQVFGLCPVLLRTGIKMTIPTNGDFRTS